MNRSEEGVRGRGLELSWTLVGFTNREREVWGFDWSKRKRGIFFRILILLAMLYPFISFWTHEYGQRRIGVLWGGVTRCRKEVLITV
jgi:hypothetical protein